MVLSGWKVGEGVALSASAEEARGGRARGPICPMGAARPRRGGHLERRVRTAWPPQGARPAPAAAREPPGWELEAAGKSLRPEAGQRRLRSGCSRHLAARDSLRKEGGWWLQCAQSFGWRSKTQRGPPRKLWSEQEGDPGGGPKRTRGDRTSGFCSPHGILGWVEAQPFNPSRPGGTNFALIVSGWTPAGWAAPRLPAQPFCDLAHFPSQSSFSVLLCPLLCPETRQAGWGFYSSL